MVKKVSGRKYFVLDTSVFVHQPAVIDHLGDNVVIVPIWVLEELDHLKTRQDYVGECARRASQIIDGYREKANKLGKSLNKGVATEAGGLLFTDFDGEGCANLPVPLESTNDNKIIAVAWAWEKKHPKKVVLLSKDINLRTKADCLGIRAENFKAEQLVERLENVYTGRVDIQVGSENAYLLTDLGRLRHLPGDTFSSFVNLSKLVENQCCWVKAGDKFSLALWRKGEFHAIPRWTPKNPDPNVVDVKPCNPEQAAAYALLMDPGITFVTLSGQAGCGKTLMALSAAYNQVVEGHYDKIVVFRLTHEVGEKIGFLPGDHGQKLDPWAGPIKDNMSLILANIPRTEGIDPFTSLVQDGQMEISSINFIRGRSIRRAYIIVDDAQGLTAGQAKTLLSRVAEGTKIVFTGDPEQIDNRYVDKLTNGLVFSIEKMKGNALVGHLTLLETQRSPLADLVAKNM